MDINGFKGQQYRWTKGSVQTGRKLLGRILRAPLPWKVKFEAFVHLTNNTSYALMVVMALLIFPAMIIRGDATWWDMLIIDLPLFLSATVSVLIFYMASQSAAGLGWKTQLRYLPAVMGLGIGLSVNNARAVLSGLFQRGGTFHRTPKYRIESQGEDWLKKRYRSGRNVSLWIELAMALYFLSCFVYAVVHEMWISLPFLFLFVQGYTYMTVLALLPALRDREPRPDASIRRKTARAQITDRTSGPRRFSRKRRIFLVAHGFGP